MTPSAASSSLSASVATPSDPDCSWTCGRALRGRVPLEGRLTAAPPVPDACFGAASSVALESCVALAGPPLESVLTPLALRYAATETAITATRARPLAAAVRTGRRLANSNLRRAGSSCFIVGKPSAAQASNSAANVSLGVSRSACNSALICSSVSLIDGPPQLFDHPVQPGAGVRLAGAGHRGDLGVGQAGEEFESDQLALAAVERVECLLQRRPIDGDVGGIGSWRRGGLWLGM